MVKKEKEKIKVTKKKPKKLLSKLSSKNTEEIIFDLKLEKDFQKFKASELINPKQLKEYCEGDNLPKWSFDYIRHIYQTQIQKASVLLIRMILINGKTASFYVNTAKPIFFYQNGAYIIDTGKIKEDVSTGHASLFFFQQASLPFLFTGNLEKIRSIVFNSEDESIKEIAENIDPQVLKSTVTSTLIKQVMAGGLLDKQLRAVIIIMVVNIVLTIILLLGTLINGFI